MAENKEGAPPSADEQSAIPSMMWEQAQAAAASEQDTSDHTAAQRRHMGRDVPVVADDDDHADIPSTPPPAYGAQNYGTVHNEQEGFATNASVADDGRVNISIKQQNWKLSNLLVPALRHQQNITDREKAPPPAYIPPFLGGEEGVPPPPPMNVVIHVVGSRGDVQPFVALGKVLQETYGHRVRLATHPVFKDFIAENGLEFFSIGADPAELMAFMVKNPGLMPKFDSVRSGDVGKRRREVGEYLKGCWRSCFETGDGLGPAANDDTVEDWTSRATDSTDASSRPFVADCIIANPPSFAHVHCAEKLGIPLHIMFTMPYSPTQAFPHPLANIQNSNADPHLTNYISYTLIDMLTWQGLGDIINGFRNKSLGLEPMSLMWAPGMLQRLKIPHTYAWSPALIPKPKDWGQTISISGFFFLNLASNYTPAPDLKAFLDAGPPPVYIGFGSIVLDDPNALTQIIFEAVRQTGQRVLLSKGWGGMGAEELGVPDGVFMLGNVPHDWLFKHVSCLVHHGGAGTTAAGITAGRPTVVIPFFGDQPFWGAMVARAGAGPEPIPHKELTAEKLADAINFCLRPESQERAQELATKIAKENGSEVGAQSFHQMMDVDKLRCTVFPNRAAVWRLRRTQVRLSALAACTLSNEGLLDFKDLKLFRAREYETDDGPWDPVTGGATAIVGTMSTMMMGIADMPINTLKALNIHPDAAKRKKSNVSTEESEDQQSSSASKTTVSSTDSQSGQGASLNSGTSTPQTSQSVPPTSNEQDTADESQGKPGPSNFQKTSTAVADVIKSQFVAGSGPDSRASQPDIANIATVVGTGKGMQKILGAGFKSPMDFTMAVAKGFHNAPKLYGDDTVREKEPVTDFRTGLKAATKQFGYGFYDGITGLVTQPMLGAKKEGAAGMVKGFGKGLGGIVLKPGSAIFGLTGYAMKGVYKEMQSHFGSSVQNYIVAARTAQGFDEWQRSSVEERQIIVARWNVLKKDLKRKKNPDEIVRELLEEQKRRGSSLKQEIMSGLESAKRQRSRSNTARKSSSSDSPPEQPAQTEHDHDHDDADFEEAIRRSVRETSNGDPEEDLAIERAIRASMAVLQNQSGQEGNQQGDDDADFHRAIEASMAEAHSHGLAGDPHDDELKRALAQSLEEHRDRTPTTQDQEGPIQMYDHSHVAGTSQAEYEAQESKQPQGKTQQEKTEEEIVMEYVKKQSLLEDEHSKARSSKE